MNTFKTTALVLALLVALVVACQSIPPPSSAFPVPPASATEESETEAVGNTHVSATQTVQAVSASATQTVRVASATRTAITVGDTRSTAAPQAPAGQAPAPTNPPPTQLDWLLGIAGAIFLLSAAALCLVLAWAITRAVDALAIRLRVIKDPVTGASLILTPDAPFLAERDRNVARPSPPTESLDVPS